MKKFLVALCAGMFALSVTAPAIVNAEEAKPPATDGSKAGEMTGEKKSEKKSAKKKASKKKKKLTPEEEKP